MMKANIKKTLLFGAVIGGLCCGANAEDAMYSTDGQWNGRTWVTFSLDEQVTYLGAIMDGIVEANLALLDSRLATTTSRDALIARISAITANGPTRGEKAQEITRLYNNPLNLNIPIPAMMQVAAMRFNGGSGPELTKQLLALRRKYTAIAAKESR